VLVSEVNASKLSQNQWVWEVMANTGQNSGWKVILEKSECPEFLF